MKFKLLLTLTLLILSLEAAAQENGFIGFRHKGVVVGETLPNGAKDLGGGLLSDEDYAVSRFAKGKKHYLWLEKITERDDEGIPSWEVKDALEFRALKKNQKFLFSYSSTCTVGGEDDIDTIVFAELSRGQKKYKILKAWKANTETEKFEKISTDEIECRVEIP